MDICSAKTPQKNQGKPAVTTRGSIDGPKGSQKSWIRVGFCRRMTDSIIPFPAAACSRRFAQLAAPAGAIEGAHAQSDRGLPSDRGTSCRVHCTTSQIAVRGRPSEAAGRPSCLASLGCLSALSGCLLSVWSGSSGSSGWLCPVCLAVLLSPSGEQIDRWAVNRDTLRSEIDFAWKILGNHLGIPGKMA